MSNIQKEQGQRWENYIRKECKYLRECGLVRVDKNWEAPRIPGSQTKREKSKPDFSGFARGGQHVVFEAKANLIETRFPFSQFSDHQLSHLIHAHEWGAIAFAYVLDGLSRKWVIPVPAIESYERKGVKSFPYHSANYVYRKIEGENWLETWKRLKRKGLII